MSSIANRSEGHNDWSHISAARAVPAIVSELATRFHALRWRYACWLMVSAGASLCAGFGCAWWLLAMTDYWLELPLSLRRIGGMAVSIVALALIGLSVWRILCRSAVRPFAMHMESRFESMGQRLRTVLDLAEGKLRAPEAMLTALGHQTMARWETAQPTQILPHRTAAISLVGLVTILLCLALWSASGHEARIALQRAAGLDRHYTELLVTPGDMQVLEGLQPEVQLELRGRPDRQVVLRYRRMDETDWTEADLQATDAPRGTDSISTRTFVSKLDKISSDLQYQFGTEVGDSPVYKIKMQPKIVLLDSSAVVRPPAYTQLPERSFATDEVTVLIGSEVTISLQTNRPLKKARLMVGPNVDQLEDAPVSAVGDGSLWKFSLPSDRTLCWRFSGAGEDDAPLAPVNGKLRVRADEAPRIDWQSPADEMTVNMLAEVPMSVLVSDDYGLTHVAIVFQLGEDEEFVLKEWTIDDAEPASADSQTRKVTTRIRLDEILPLESFALTEREFISYFAIAEDNRQGGGQPAESEVRYLDIRPLKQYFSEREMPPGTGGGRRFPVLTELISRERYLYNRTRHVSRSYDSNNNDQLRTLERMVETQSELANYARFMIDFLASQGNDDTESLAQAESAMLQASDALATADFETAILRERDAIRQLVEAKNSLEVTLAKFNNPAQRLRLNNFQRQLVNRLRRKMKPAETKVADDIKQIAAEQKQLAVRVSNWLTASATSSSAQPQTASVEDQFKATQQELLDRLTTVSSDLSEGVRASTLASERMATGLLQMDALTGNSAQGKWESFPTNANELADELMELGEHAKALAESEPARRIASIRDLTASLAEKELELSNQSLRVEQVGASDRDAATDKLKERARSISGRAQTIEDVLKLPMDTGDLRVSDIVDQLEKLIAQHEFRKLLQGSTQSARNFLQGQLPENWGEASQDRARELAHLAELLDLLHRQLVAPRVEQLRRLENKASKLASAMNSNLSGNKTQEPTQSNGSGGATSSANANGGGKKKQDELDEKELRNGLMQLEAELQSAGLTELAELLHAGSSNQGEQAASDQAGTAGNDRRGMGQALAGQSSPFSHQRLVSGHRNLLVVRQKLQSMLQEMILLETTIDRAAPIPSEYKELVDAYYKSLAGE